MTRFAVPTVVAFACLLLLPPAAAKESAGFGQPGEPRFDAYTLPPSARAGEPSIGIPWDTDHSFVQAYTQTFRASFTDNATGGGAPTMQLDEVTPVFTSVQNLDPLLVVDQPTGRIFAGGLMGPCSVMAVSDDDGETWTPTVNMCSGIRFDHQSLGTGAWAPDVIPRGAAAPRATYYCGQLDTVSCATSLDGGRSWLPFLDVKGDCGSFHGHIKVDESTGLAVLPFADCGQGVGFASTTDNGLNWNSFSVPGSKLGKGIGFDPSVAFTKSGWMYYAHGNDLGIYVGLTKDGGATWATLGNSTPGATAGTWLNLSAAYEDADGRPLRYANFVNAMAGDDDRAALAFLGTTDDGTKPWVCTKESDGLVWHYYLAQTFDAGSTWTVTRLSEDPVQIGGMFDGSEGSGECRNLLDFNDATTDSKGRIHIAFADGCTGRCAEAYADYAAGKGAKPKAGESRDELGTILRQTTGRGVLAQYDVAAEPDVPTNTTQPTEEQPVPGPGMLLMVAALVAVAVVVRRRR